MILKRVSPTLLRSKLREGIIQFAFKKLDGTLRTAVGTTNMTSIPIDHHPKGTGVTSEKSVRFYDVEKREWRSVSATQEIFTT